MAKMKVDFVTNSSCASFVIMKENLSELQIVLIKNHIEASKMFDPENVYDCPWGITETDEQIEGSTSMDNFDMLWFLNQIGVDDDHIDYEGCY